MRFRREGFDDQRLVVLPDAVVRRALRHPLLRGLLPVAAGYFPAASRHLVRRQKPLPEAIVIICTDGRGWVRVAGGKAHNVGPGTLVFIPPGEAHAYGADAGDPWSIYWAHVRGGEVADFAELLGVHSRNPLAPLPREAADRLNLAEIHERLEEDYTLPNLLAAAARSRMVLAEIRRLQGRHLASTEADQVGRTIAWMREHLGQRASLPGLAKEAGMSAAHYSAKFRRQTGYSPVDYFLRMKIQHACRLLDTSLMRVHEVAAAVGYDDPFYFSRLFRRIMTKSPRAYRAAPKG